jgi:very-short-patch-repair endonuclease
VVTRRQIVELGLGRGAIDHQIAAGRLIPVHRGVYAVGHRPRTWSSLWHAAVLACGDGAVLSHRSAAAHLGLRRGGPLRPEVTAPVQRRRRGISVHVGRLTEADRDEHRGIPVTSVARTLVDLAHVLDHDALERVVRETDYQGRFDARAVREVMARRPSRRLASLVERLAPTQSGHEDELLRICARYGLPMPVTQARVGARTVDFLWPDARVIVEIDPWESHGSRTAFGNDRSATNSLQLAGYTVLRFTDTDLVRDPARVARLIRQACSSATVPPVR